MTFDSKNTRMTSLSLFIVWLSIFCNVKTAEPIWSKFCVAIHMTPGRVNVRSNFFFKLVKWSFKQRSFEMTFTAWPITGSVSLAYYRQCKRNFKDCKDGSAWHTRVPLTPLSWHKMWKILSGFFFAIWLTTFSIISITSPAGKCASQFCRELTIDKN